MPAGTSIFCTVRYLLNLKYSMSVYNIPEEFEKISIVDTTVLYTFVRRTVLWVRALST